MSTASPLAASSLTHLDHARSQDAPIRVLLVCDMQLMSASLRYLLDGHDLVLVCEASNVEEAIAAVRRDNPDVVLVDIASRHEALACVEEMLAHSERARVIALTDVNGDPAFVEFGAAGVVFRNDRPEVLVKAIKKVYSGELWLDRLHTAHLLSRITRRRRLENVEAQKIAALTKRERQIVALVGQGLKNAAIADRLFISQATARNHLTSILDKLGVSDRFELAVYAFRHELVRRNDEQDD